MFGYYLTFLTLLQKEAKGNGSQRHSTWRKFGLKFHLDTEEINVQKLADEAVPFE